MVFSSPPLFLDPPNWQQHANEALHLLPPPHSGGGAAPDSQARPSSMSERAREAKIPVPEGPLKCPRCESTNTKFCYFNNYNLSQPRHFCKGCRRYWTRGGALRNVPVGGGCRRNNKRRKSNKPAPKPTGADLGSIGSAHGNGDQLGPSHAELGVGGAYHQHQLFPATLPPPSQYSFMGSLQGLSQFSSSSSMAVGEFQQLPYLAGFGAGLYPFQSEGMGVEPTSYGSKGFGFSHLAAPLMKAEERVAPNSGGGLGGGLWTDLAGVGSSSCTTTRQHSTIGD